MIDVGWTQIAPILAGLDLERAIEAGFVAYSRGDSIVPPVGEILFDRGEAHIKCGFIRGDDTFTVKVATGFYDNPERGLPSSNGLMLIFDSKTGAPVGILRDEGHLTDIRTAIAGAISARALAPKKIDRIGILGSGAQARLQLEYLRGVTDCRNVIVYGRSEHSTMAFCDELLANKYNATIASHASEVGAQSNLIVTTTPAIAPVLMAGDVRPGTHITAVGTDSAHKNELDPALFAEVDVIVADSILQCSERGNLHHALEHGYVKKERVVELGQVLSGTRQGRTSDKQITLTDLTGVAVQDIKIAQCVFQAILARQATQ